MESNNYLETEQADEPLPQMDRTFHWRGKPLEKYSWLARAALFRICRGRSVAFEEYPYLIFLLLTRKPTEWDAIRDEKETAAFREEAAKWADAEGVADDEGWDELKKTAESILGAVKRARTLEPVSEGPGSKKE
jgi:hypothetical protein